VGSPRERMTARETRVLRFLPTHLHAPEIAGELDVLVNTVRTHVRHLYQKLGAHGRREAVERARAFGLLTALRLGDMADPASAAFDARLGEENTMALIRDSDRFDADANVHEIGTRRARSPSAPLEVCNDHL
jgi:DNA-binding CsgD family transcriptional regulator